MTREEIGALIDYNIDDKFKAELLSIYTGTPPGPDVELPNRPGRKSAADYAMSPKTAALGLLFLNGHPDVKLPEDYYRYRGYYREILPEGPRYAAFKAGYELATLWEGEHYSLLNYFFGEERAPYIRLAWEEIRNLMYQTGWDRRSFRRPHHQPTIQVRQLNLVSKLVNDENSPALSLPEAIKYSHLYHQARERANIWAAAIDDGHEAVYKTLTDILLGEAEEGVVSRLIIKALLLSHRPEAWEQVGKLLLAAQRQEGLRQVILESLDETSVGAMSYLLDIIVEHKLIRFSAVVRALDTWAGFGWDAEQQSTVKRFAELARTYFQNPELIDTAIRSKDNAEVYMALWGLGAHDIDKCYPYLKDLYARGGLQKKSLALLFVYQTGITEWEEEFGQLAFYEDHPQLQYWGVKLLPTTLTTDKSALFKRAQQLYLGMEKESLTFKKAVFSWLNPVFERSSLSELMVNVTELRDHAQIEAIKDLYGDMEIGTRETFVRKMLPDHYSSYYNRDEKKRKVTTAERGFAFSILKDRSSSIRDTAMRALLQAEFTAEEMPVFEQLLTRKSAASRQFVIEIIQKRPAAEVLASAQRLIGSRNVQQRLGALDLLNYLLKQGEFKAEVIELATAYAERPNIGTKEQVLLDALLSGKTTEYNAENGFGLYNPRVKTLAQPIGAPDSGAFYDHHHPQSADTGLAKKLIRRVIGRDEEQSGHPYGLSVPLATVQEQLEKLEQLYLANKEFEYGVKVWDGSTVQVLLGNTFRKVDINTNDKDMPPREEYESYPLPQVWETWFKNSGLTSFDLYTINNAYQHLQESSALYPISYQRIRKYLPLIPLPLAGEEEDEDKASNVPVCGPLLPILRALLLIFPYENKLAYSVGKARQIISRYDDAEMHAVHEIENRWRNQQRTIFDTEWHSHFLPPCTQFLNDDTIFPDYWNLRLFVYQNQHEKADRKHELEFQEYCHAYSLGLLSKDELYRCMMTPDAVQLLTTPYRPGTKQAQALQKRKLFERYDFLPTMVEEVTDRLLDIELNRGDSSTAVTRSAQNIQVVYGLDNLVQILKGLGKDTLYRGYIYSYGNTAYSKKEVLSHLLQHCRPLKTTTQEEFNEKIAAANVSEKRLIEVGLYNQRWLPFIASYLNWNGLESAAWWLHAHTNDRHDAQTETEIARYSAIEMSTFKDGAVDYDWFQQAYSTVGKQRWKMLYDAAKYISDGTGHTRAKLYADVMTGNTKIREIKKRIKEKRNKDYVRVYGLVPLSKKTPDKDLLARYNYLLQFKKESRQFGAQRQTSEQLAVRIALENLARTAGYPDPIRLTWAMETAVAKSIMEKSSVLNFGDVSFELVINDKGQPSILSKRKDKLLKDIPAKLRKDKEVVQLKQNYKQLKEQFSRSRKSLEGAMVRGDELRAEEIHNLSEHPVISPMLSTLALISDGKTGFYRGGKLRSETGEHFDLGATVRIAHCTDFHEHGNWSDLQRYCFEEKVVQPFKQIFRELYVPTADELKEGTKSRRYAGHQVQPRKTVALLKTRGWTVDYEEGLQKVFHAHNMIAKMYAMADWFSPADVESPTLETLEFMERGTYKAIAFKDIPARIFSETMRDMDLVVSVAHVGGVDPEASHSTIEMRAAILRETARLFKLDNVELKGNHAHIKGHYGDYSVHLGSAVTHMLPGKYISILPVHSQHRGKLFLPFMDDDPRSAELMAKILLLAKDQELKDPTILTQIVG